MLEYPLLGFAPDLPQDTQGVVVESNAILPTSRGFGSGLRVTTNGTVFTGPSMGGARLLALDGSSTNLIGTATKLYKVQSGTTSNVSGATYHASNTDTWSFAQFGSVSLAVNHGDKLQAREDGTNLFADADSSAPKASIVITPGLPNAQFAMLFDYDDGTDVFGDGIFWSALSDYTDWTPDIATECGNVRIIDLGGPFTAAIPYRDGVIAFKRRSMYLGTYVGGAAVWSWTRISSDVGCIGKNAVCVGNDVIYFADEFGLWTYDGSYPRPMPGYVHQHWSNLMLDFLVVGASATAYSKNFVRLTWDKRRHLLWAGYGGPIIATTAFLVFNERSQRWTSYGGLTDTAGTVVVHELFDLEHSSQYIANAGNALPLTVDPQFGDGGPPANFMRLAPHGKTYGMTLFSSIRPQFLVGPSDTATGWVSGAVYYGPSVRNVTSTSKALTFTAPSKLEGTQESRFVSPRLDFTSGTPWECSKVGIDVRYRDGD